MIGGAGTQEGALPRNARSGGRKNYSKHQQFTNTILLGVCVNSAQGHTIEPYCPGFYRWVICKCRKAPQSRAQQPNLVPPHSSLYTHSMLQSAAQQVLWPTSLALQLWRVSMHSWSSRAACLFLCGTPLSGTPATYTHVQGGAASRQLAAAAVAGANRSTTSSGTHSDSLQGLSHHQQSLPQSSKQQQPRTPGWLQQLTSCSRQERMAALSSLTISLQGKVAELITGGYHR